MASALMVGRVVLVVAGLVIAGVAIFFATRELNEVSEVTPGQEPGPTVGGAKTVVVRMKGDEFHPDNVSIRGVRPCGGRVTVLGG